MRKATITEEMILSFQRSLVDEERSEKTIEKYIRDVRGFACFVGEKNVDKQLVIEYKKHLIAGYAPASVNSMLAAVNRFLKEIGRYDCLVKAIKIQRISFRDKDRELTKAEYFRLLETAKRKKKTRLYLMMQTICTTGIRVSELEFITIEAIRSGRAQVSLKGKTRQVLLPAALCHELKRYAKDRKIVRGCVFVTRNNKSLDRSNILHEMKKLCAEANVAKSKVFPHNLRHLFACMYYKVSKDISHLADILGHSSINTTRIYTCVSGVEQQKQIERLGLLDIKTA